MLQEMAACNSVQEQLLVAVLHLSSLREDASVNTWRITPDLEINIVQYTRAFLLSSQVSFYRGQGMDTATVGLMRDLKVNGLPPSQQPSQIQVITSAVNSEFTYFRSTMKSKIIASLEPNSQTGNIANLTANLLSTTTIRPTLQLYLRVAFLRWAYLDAEKHETESGAPATEIYWEWVDKALLENLAEFPSKREMTEALNGIYKSDIKRWGSPALTHHQTVEPKDVEAWLSSVDAAAAKTLPGKVSKKKRASAANSRPKKRARTSSENEEEAAQ
ncbi:hypothetical protein BKA70DRAFT_1292980 [Coprinopsis sp. MPI-PUGE-AT-0042]|nr:hypothetical protein BKA70DRAFT_1292980 [Coprinopsis sp. MPI-PUGE-AT-0042]